MKFFVLANPRITQIDSVTDFVLVDGFATGPAPRCGVCGRAHNLRPLLPPVRVELRFWGTKPSDIALGSVNEFLVTDRFWHRSLGAGLTGLIHVGPVEVSAVARRNKRILPLLQYQCCRAAFSRTTIDRASSGLEFDPPEVCSECRLGGILKRTKRVVIEPDSWLGEDVFIARGLPGTILVSERFREFCRANEVPDCLFTPVEEFSFDFYPWEKK